MPGLSDLTRLGKIWFHADVNATKSPEVFEKIVVDMPSSGYVARFLSIASVVEDVVKIGPLAEEARLINQYFSNPRHARLHLATVLEDLIITESMEFYHQIANARSVEFGCIFINRAMPEIFDNLIDLDLERSEKLPPTIGAIIAMFKERRLEERLQRGRLAKGAISLPEVVITDLPGEDKEAKIVEHMIEELLIGPIFSILF
ncbi:MAG TPA: hypothetical protein VEL47_02915 [Myxococcota bacterium]|nr:hypothetical protein [Myxococcota bacterium]